MPREIADLAVKSLVWQGQSEGNSCIVNHPLPAANSIGNLINVVIAQAFVQRGQRRHVLGDDFSTHDFGDRVFRIRQNVIVLQLRFAEAPFQSAGEIVRGVRRNIGAIKIERNAVVKVQVFLDRRQVNHAERAHVRWIFDLVFLHYLASPLNNASNARLADKHMVRFFGEHEPASARKRIKTGFRERAELELAVAVGEKCKHVKSQPIWRRFVKRAENARVVGIAGAPREQGLRFFTAIAAEVAV